MHTFADSDVLVVSNILQPVMSDHGLLTTVAYKLGRDKPACYALEVQFPIKQYKRITNMSWLHRSADRFCYLLPGIRGHRRSCGPLAARQSRDHRVVRRARYTFKKNRAAATLHTFFLKQFSNHTCKLVTFRQKSAISIKNM